MGGKGDLPLSTDVCYEDALSKVISVTRVVGVSNFKKKALHNT